MADGEPAEEVTIEAKSHDDAWYPCSLKFTRTKVHVHFTDYDSEEDETWDLSEFTSREDVSNKVRITSEQLQDARCGDLSVGLHVCALKELDDDEKKYFDAEVRKIEKHEHLRVGAENEECRCKFTIKWDGGPMKGKEEGVDCAAITVLSDRNAEEHLQLAAFFKLVVNRGTTTAPKNKSVSTGGKRRAYNRRAGKSLGKAASPEGDEPATGAAVEGQGGKENNAWQTTPAARMTEKEINSTINEVCDDVCAGSPDWQSGSDTASKGKRPVLKKMKVSPAKEPEAKTPSTQRVSSKGDEVAQGSRALPQSKANGMEGRTLGFNTPPPEFPAELPVKGVEDFQESLLEVEGFAVDTPVVEGRAVPIGPVPEPDEVAEEYVVLLSDDEDEESRTQRSPQVKNSSTKPESGCSQPQPACDGSQLKEEVATKESVCSGVWPTNSVLRIENVEKALDPREATKFLSSMIQDLITVILSPSGGETEPGTFGFAFFKDSASAGTALNLLNGNCLVTSNQQRPWLVTLARDTAEERELIAYTARGNCIKGRAQEGIERATGAIATQQHRSLRWVLPQMKDFKLANDLLDLFKDHKKEAHTLRKKYNREEATRRLNFSSS